MTTKSTRRPKGYADWNPQPHVMAILRQVQEVLDEYSRYGPMTARQIFYRLVGEYGFEKTEQAYNRLASYLVRARRARMIDFDAIRDDGTSVRGGGGWSEKGQFWRAVQGTAKSYTLDKQLNQPYSIELWCEAAGMLPMLANMVSDWNIPVYSTGGFSSVTVTHEVSQRVYYRNRPTVFLHVGDFDPSGESIFESMSQDIGSFVAEETEDAMGYAYWDSDTGYVEGRFEPERVALTRDQVARYNLPTAPPKRTDSRSASWVGETTQAEALPPDLLRSIVRDKVAEFIDLDILEETKRQEQLDKTDILGKLDRMAT